MLHPAVRSAAVALVALGPAMAQTPAAADVPVDVPVDMEVVVTAPLAGSEIERGKVPSTPASCGARTCNALARPARCARWTSGSATSR